MSMATLERAILAELRDVTGKRKLRKKDMMEWSSGDIEPQEGETLVYLPGLKINVAYKVVS
jgi:hypothetical protein